MYFPDFNGAGHALSIPVAPAQQHLDLIPRLLLDVAGTAFLVIVLLLVGPNLYGAVSRVRSLRGIRGVVYRPRHARPRPLRGAAVHEPTAVRP